MSGYDVTIATLVRNAGPILPRLLRAVYSQETTRRVEFLVIDSGSTDGSLELLRAHPVRLIQIPRETFNWGKTRDLAYQEAQAPIIINLSQDAVPQDPTWLDNLIRPLEDPAIGVSCGLSVPDPDRHFMQFPWERNGYFYFTREIAKFVATYGRGLSFANSAVSRKVWEQLRFDEQPTGEDFQFQQKLYGAGYRIAFTTEAPVLHHHDYTFRGLFRRCRNEGYALHLLGFSYTEWDLFRDLISTPKYVQWLRELKYNRLHSLAAYSFPVVRPVAVYMGSRFTRRPIWY